MAAELERIASLKNSQIIVREGGRNNYIYLSRADVDGYYNQVNLSRSVEEDYAPIYYIDKTGVGKEQAESDGIKTDEKGSTQIIRVYFKDGTSVLTVPEGLKNLTSGSTEYFWPKESKVYVPKSQTPLLFENDGRSLVANKKHYGLSVLDISYVDYFTHEYKIADGVSRIELARIYVNGKIAMYVKPRAVSKIMRNNYIKLVDARTLRSVIARGKDYKSGVLLGDYITSEGYVLINTLNIKAIDFNLAMDESGNDITRIFMNDGTIFWVDSDALLRVIGQDRPMYFEKALPLTNDDVKTIEDGDTAPASE